MMIQISSGDKDDARTVIITDEDMDPVELKADNLSHAHKLIKQGRADGWETVTPAALAKQTKAETVKETARVEAGKAAAEPKGK